MLYYLTGLLAVSSYALLPVISKKIQADIPSFAYIAITMFFYPFLLVWFLSSLKRIMR